jgi:hypothetical protein
MALASATATNQALDGLSGGTTNLLAFLQLHIGTTGTTGTNESTATRQAATWNAASAGSKTNSSSHTFTTQAAGTAVTYVGTWSLVTAGVFGIGAQLTTPVTAASITIAPGAITLTAA